MLQNGKQHKGRGLVRVVIRQAGAMLEHGGSTRSCVKLSLTSVLGVKATEEESEEKK